MILRTLLFCACSFLSGIAGSFLLLIGARLLMGAAEGGVMPISHAMIVSEVKPERRGLAMGVGQNLGSNLLGFDRGAADPGADRRLARLALRLLPRRDPRADHRRADLGDPARAAQGPRKRRRGGA